VRYTGLNIGNNQGLFPFFEPFRAWPLGFLDNRLLKCLILRILIFRDLTILLALTVDILIDPFLFSIAYILEGSEARIDWLSGLLYLLIRLL
jgi:hypothetical protein